MLAAAVVFYVLTLLGVTTPWVLLALTFALGLGAAMNAPAWQAITPDLVPRDALPSAVTLNGVSVNLARAVGPAIGGFIVAAAGPAPVFLLNAISFLGVILILFRWHPPPATSVLLAERVMGAIRAGLRYARYAPALNTLLIRTITFILFGSALWALLPQVVNHDLQAGAIGYGLLLGCLGLGAVIGATVLLPLRQKFAIDRVVAGASLAFAFATLSLAFLHALVVLCLSMFMGGVAWIAAMSSLNTVAQVVVPAWVRARALSIYLLVFQGGLAVGSILWGSIAERTSTSIALSLAALGLALGGVLAVRWHMAAGEQMDVTPVSNWPEPHLMLEPRLEDGPVLVISAYVLEPDQRADFVQAMYALQQVRRRNGAIRWGLFQDPVNPDRYVETFVIESWAENLRLHEHLTVADLAVYHRARAFGTSATPISTTRLIAIPPPKKRSKAHDETLKPSVAVESKAQATSPTVPG